MDCRSPTPCDFTVLVFLPGAQVLSLHFGLQPIR